MSLGLGTIMKHLYPDAIPLVDYTVQNDGDGEYISQWDLPTEKPSKEYLLAKSEEIETKIESGKKKDLIVAQLEDLDRKTIRALREGDTVRLADLEDKAKKLRAKLV